MLTVETIAKIRRMYHVQKKGYKTIARDLRLSKNTVKKTIREDKTSYKYERTSQVYPILGAYINILKNRLMYDKNEPRRRKRSAKKLYQELCQEGYRGTYEAVNNFVRKWKNKQNQGGKTVYVPLEFDPGEAFQFDWSEEEIELAGKMVRIKVAHIRLCYSRLFLTIAYPNEQLEMVMDAHDKAFQFFSGCCCKGIYDNMKTAVQKVLIGKNRDFNKRFAELASHYLFEPIACTPAAGWEKGQVENQVNTSRCNFFSPLCRVNSLDELNVKLQELCLAWAQKARHPEFKDKTVWEVYQKEKPYLLDYRSSFDAYKIQATVISSYSLINYETNAYSVDCFYVGKQAEIRIYAKHIIVVSENKEIASHKRCFGRYQRIYNPWHYISVLEKKPGALRNGAPFKHLKLPSALEKIRLVLSKYSDGDKQFIKILLQIQLHGLKAVEQACTLSLKQGISSSDFIMQILQKNHIKATKNISAEITINHPPNDNCLIYNQLLSQKVICQEGYYVT